MKNPWLEKRKQRKKCEYRLLSKKEKKIIDPHRYKPKKGGSKLDLSVCRGSGCKDRGEVVRHRKNWYYDDNGNIIRPKDIEYEPIGINIEDPEWEELIEVMKNKYDKTTEIIEFRIMDFDRPPEEIVKALGFTEGVEIWKKGENWTTKLKYQENGFSIPANEEDPDFETRVSNLLNRVHRKRRKLKEMCGNYYAELSCAIYVVGDDIPALHLPERSVKQLGDLEAEIDLDLYFLSETEET